MMLWLEIKRKEKELHRAPLQRLEVAERAQRADWSLAFAGAEQRGRSGELLPSQTMSCDHSSAEHSGLQTFSSHSAKQSPVRRAFSAHGYRTARQLICHLVGAFIQRVL